MDWCEWFGFEFDPFFDKPLESDKEIEALMVIEKKIDEQVNPLIRQMKIVPFICLVAGERGIGKSTFLYYANSLSAKANCLPVYVALDHTQVEFSAKPPYEIQKSLMYEFASKLLDAVEKRKDFFNSNRTALFELARFIGVAYNELDGFVPSKERFRVDLFELKRYILATIRLLQKSNIPILLSVDNLDRIGDSMVLESFFKAPGAQSLFDELRKEGVSLLIAMSNDFMRIQKRNSYLNYLNQSVVLGDLSPNQVLELVKKRIAFSNSPSPSNPFDEKAVYAIGMRKKGITREILTEARSLCSKAYEQRLNRITEEFTLKGLSSFDECRTFYEIVDENENAKMGAISLCELASHSEVATEEAVKVICSVEEGKSTAIKSEFLAQLIDFSIVRPTVSEEYTFTQPVTELFAAIRKSSWHFENFLSWIFAKESMKVLVTGVPGTNIIQAIEAFGPIPLPKSRTINIVVGGTCETYPSSKILEDAKRSLEDSRYIASSVGKLTWDDIDNVKTYQNVYWALCHFLDAFSRLYICCASSSAIKIKSWKRDDFYENTIHHCQEEFGVSFASFFRFQHFTANINGIVRGGFVPSHSNVRTAFEDYETIVREFTQVWQGVCSKTCQLEAPDKQHDETVQMVGEFSSLLGYTNRRPEFQQFNVNGEEYLRLGFSKFPLNDESVDMVAEKMITDRLGSVQPSYFIADVSPVSDRRTTSKDILTFIKKVSDLTSLIGQSCQDFRMPEGFPKYFLLYVSTCGFDSGIGAATKTAQLPANSQILTIDRNGLQNLIRNLRLPNRFIALKNADEQDANVMLQKNLEALLSLRLKIAEIVHEKYEKTTTIMLADLENFTGRTEENRLESAETVVKMSQILTGEVERYGGKGMNVEGDSYIAFFDKADQAVEAALKAVETIENYNETVLDQKKIRIHIGLSSGEILFNNGFPFVGDAVNIAARIMKKVDSNRVVISETTYKEICGFRGFDFIDKGLEELKGIKKPVRIYEIHLKEIVKL